MMWDSKIWVWLTFSIFLISTFYLVSGWCGSLLLKENEISFKNVLEVNQNPIKYVKKLFWLNYYLSKMTQNNNNNNKKKKKNGRELSWSGT